MGKNLYGGGIILTCAESHNKEAAMIYRNPFTRLFKASVYSLQGLYFAVKNEQAFRYESATLIMICALLCVMPFTLWHKAFLVAMWLGVMAFELVNSAVEKAFDLIDEKYRPEIKAGKDMLSAAVFLMICANILAWAGSIASTYIFPQAG